MKPRPLLIVFLFLLAGAGLGMVTRRPFPSRHLSRSSPNNAAWEKLTPERQKALSTAHQRYLAMNADKRRLIQDRWQYYRHLPAWRQEEMLREYEQWKKMHPGQLAAL